MVDGQRQWIKETLVEKGIKEVQAEVTDLKEMLTEISMINIPPGLKAKHCATYIHKAKLIQSAVTKMKLLGHKLADTSQRIGVRLSQKKKEIDPLRIDKEYTVNCFNDESLSWEEAFANVHTETDFPGPLSMEQILSAGKIISSEGSISIAELAKTLQFQTLTYFTLYGIAMNICQWFPVLSITKGNRGALLDVHTVLLSDELISELLTLDQPDKTNPQPDTVTPEASTSTNNPRSKPGPKKGHGGRPAIHSVGILYST